MTPANSSQELRRTYLIINPRKCNVKKGASIEFHFKEKAVPKENIVVIIS